MTARCGRPRGSALPVRSPVRCSRRKALTARPPLEAFEETPPVVAPGSAENGHAEIIRTKQFTDLPMTVEEAALQMDLLGHDFYLFKDAQTKHATVLYRRRDGHLGLIEAVE